jgi:hypothetical protein
MSSVGLLYKTVIENCIHDAELGISGLSDDILALEGMSGKKTRHFYNTIVKNTPNPVYLEIGTWKGSSVCSAMYDNTAKVVCIDNWGEFGGPKDQFIRLFELYKGKNDATFIERDCFTVDVTQLPTFNIYMYDGGHSYKDHYTALTHYIDCMDNTFIFIVDDWNWERVRTGTRDSIRDLCLEIVYEKEIRTSMDESVPPEPALSNNWWNGIYIAVLQKKN